MHDQAEKMDSLIHTVVLLIDDTKVSGFFDYLQLDQPRQLEL